MNKKLFQRKVGGTWNSCVFVLGWCCCGGSKVRS